MRTVFLTTLMWAVCLTAAESCTISQPGFAGGTYNPTNTTFSAGSVSVTGCTPNTTVTLTMDTGLHSTSVSPRVAQSGANTLQYMLRKVNQLGQVVSTWSLTTDASGNATFALWLTAPSGQTPPIGTYTDTVGETITF